MNNKNIYQHINIDEKDKPNAFSSGKSLWIGEEVKTLDQINNYYVKCLGSVT